jgi:hypothetical protein
LVFQPYRSKGKRKTGDGPPFGHCVVAMLIIAVRSGHLPFRKKTVKMWHAAPRSVVVYQSNDFLPLNLHAVFSSLFPYGTMIQLQPWITKSLKTIWVLWFITKSVWFGFENRLVL